MTNRFILAGLLLAATGLVSAVLLEALDAPPQDPSAQGQNLASRPESRPAPPFNLPMRAGQRLALADLQGKWVLLNFWATWCEPCKAELPHLAIAARALSERPLRMVLVSVDDKWADIDGLISEIKGMAGTQEANRALQDTISMLQGGLSNVVNLLDSAAKTPQSYGTRKYPETYLIDPQGTIRYLFIGPMPWGRPQAIESLERLMKSPREAAAAPAADQKAGTQYQGEK